MLWQYVTRLALGIPDRVVCLPGCQRYAGCRHCYISRVAGEHRVVYPALPIRTTGRLGFAIAEQRHDEHAVCINCPLD